MTLKVDYLPFETIEYESAQLINSFEKSYGKITTLSTPIEEIIENHLGLAFEFGYSDDPSILGSLDIKNNLITINERLHLNPTMKGRYNFTLAHEVGHQILHRPYFEEYLSSEKIKEETILCRMENRRDSVEIQADQFSACILMPKDKVFKRVKEITGRSNFECNRLVRVVKNYGLAMDASFPDERWNPDEQILTQLFKNLADEFKVSKQSFYIRLKKLGVLTGELKET